MHYKNEENKMLANVLSNAFMNKLYEWVWGDVNMYPRDRKTPYK